MRDAFTIGAAIGGAAIVAAVGFFAVRAIAPALGGVHATDFRFSVPVGIIAGVILFATLLSGKKEV